MGHAPVAVRAQHVALCYLSTQHGVSHFEFLRPVARLDCAGSVMKVHDGGRSFIPAKATGHRLRYFNDEAISMAARIGQAMAAL